MSARSIVALILITVGAIIFAFILSVSTEDAMVAVLLAPVGIIFLILGCSLLGLINKKWGV